MWGYILAGFVGAVGGFATAAVVFAGVRADLRSKIILARMESAQVKAEDSALFLEVERALAQAVYEGHGGSVKPLGRLRAIVKSRS